MAPREGHVLDLTASCETLFLGAKVALLIGQERLSLMSDRQQENTIMIIYGLLY